MVEKYPTETSHPPPANNGGRSALILREIRGWYLGGTLVREIARRLEQVPHTIESWICFNELDAPADWAEEEFLMLWSEYRRINRLLDQDDLAIDQRCKLVGALIKLSQAISRIQSPPEPKESDMPKSPRAQAEFDRIEALSEEDLDNEIRQLAGLESKQSEPVYRRDTDPEPTSKTAAQSLHHERSPGPEAP